MSDLSDASGQMPRRPRVSDGGAPVSGALAIVLALVAVVAGYLILRSITDNGESALDFPASESGSLSSGDDTADTGADATGTTVPVAPTTTTTVPQIVTDGADVIVANANSVGGSAGQMKRALETGPGFTVVDAVNGSAAIGDVFDSAIYYDATNPQAQLVAESLSEVLGGVSNVAPLSGTPPTDDGDLRGATVLLLLGDDIAGKTLAELNPTSVETATQVTNPPIAATATSAPDG
jgi:hypothetical protein